MKKAIILLMVGATTTLFAQTQQNQFEFKTSSYLETEFQNPPISDLGLSKVLVPPRSQKSTLGKYRSEVYDFVQIGYSYYDLQTNASIGPRALLHGDGTITFAWTFSGAASITWDDRGTGINYYNGTNWGSFPTVRTESSRTGWPSIGMLSDGKMYTLAHDFDGGGLIMTKNSGKGKTDWTTIGELLNYTGGEPIWNRTGNNGNIMHVLTNFSGQPGVTDVIIDSIINPTTYSRSKDGGQTWVDEHILLPGYDSTRYARGGGDTYAIDVRDSVVAIAIGGRTKDLTIWKSMDNGENWTKMVADSFPFPAFEWGSKLIDPSTPARSNDGAIDVLIDNNNNVHVVYGGQAFWDQDLTDEFMSVSPYYNLFHWSENNPSLKVCGTPINMDEDFDPNTGAPIYTFTGETTSPLVNGVPRSGLSYGAQYGGTSISTHPSLSVDASNRIFVTYDCPVELTFHDYNANFRDVHISYSTDGGANWAVAQNATQLREKEAVFACMTKRTNDYVHFLFQEDIHPGTNLQNSGSGGLHPNVENIINYAAIPVQDILDNKLGQNTLSNRPLDYDSKVFVVSQNYPNPFSAITNVVIYLRNGSDLSYTITDASGKVVSHEILGFHNAGNHEVQIDGNALSNGIYFYTLRTKDNEVTRKMNVVN